VQVWGIYKVYQFKNETTKVWAPIGALLALLLALFVGVSPLSAQVVTATLTGTVSDATGAVIAGATVVVKNEASGDVRRTVSNGEGFFTVTAIQPGTYSVTVEAKGFNNWEQKGIGLNAGDKRNVSDIALAVGSGAETVTVEATVADISPVDSGEKAAVIGTKQLENISIVGANATEFIKILPGMAITGGTQNGASYSGETAGTGSGPIGSFSANGQRTGALDITSDGAHVIDPGCNCGQAVNVNVDMTQEMKVLTSNFGADAQKGPVFISAVGKSGGAQFHGSAFFYARHNSLNANDALNNAQGTGADGKPLAGRPETKYIYPGGTIGGPVILPFTRFNKNHDKLFFFLGYEYYNQQVDNGIYQSFVPTAEMRKGNFAQSYIDSLHGATDIGYQVSGAANFPNGQVPASEISKIGQNLMNLYPLPNANAATTGGFNYVSVGTKPQNAYQVRPRVDWSINDNTKLFFSYNRQRDTAYYTDTLWWRPTPTVPYPTRLIAANMSDSYSVNLTKVFSPSLTNEFVFTWTLLDLPNSFEDPKKVDPAALGVSYPTIFKAGLNQITTMTGWGGGFANMIQPSGFQITGSLYAKKKLPTISDNVTKVAGTHTMKFGFYWEGTLNDQPSSNNSNGQAQFANWGGNTTGNAYADLLAGRIAAYSETNKDVLLVMKYQTVDFFAQDSWKISRRLTLDYGMRFSHLGPWNDQRGSGLAIFDQSKYSNNPADVNKLTGVLWNAIDKSVPLGGMGTRSMFYNPRGGFAWDVLGSGKTVLRGGVGVYRFHDEQNVQSGALGITQGVYGYSTPQAVTFDQIGNYSSTNFIAPSSITVLDRHDDNQPKTTSYSFTISQRTPFSALLEVAYVGNKSSYLSNWNNNFGKLNAIPFGTLYKTPGTFTDGNNYSPNADPLRPFQNYSGLGGIKLINHEMYSNYNSLQVSWNKQSGRVNYLANYTFSKALGIRGEGGSATGDPTSLANNYGTLPNDRTHIFNIAYVIQMPNPIHKFAVAKALVNGWQISGITQFQSGPGLQAVNSSNFNISSTLPAGTVLPDGTVLSKSVGASSALINGSPDINMQPILTCDPSKNLGTNQFINSSCFAAPTPGHNGAFIMPYIKGPAFFNNDLSVFKNFNISEHKKLQFRASAYNFLNHPLRSFINSDNNLNLNFDASGKLTNQRFGYADWTIGKRIIQLAVKFYF
jgi:hypothetical protein